MFNWVINMKEMKYIAFGLIGAVFIDGIAFTIFSLASGKYGDLADWISGLGTLAAFFAVFWQQRKQEEMERAFRIEQSRPRFVTMERGNLPKESNVLLDSNYDNLEEKVRKDLISLATIVDYPHMFKLATFKNISDNTVYSLEIIGSFKNGKKAYWKLQGLDKNGIVVPIPSFLLEEVSNFNNQNEKVSKLNFSKVEMRFITSKNEMGFYEYENENEKYYFINNLKNSCIQPTHDGEMLDKEAKLTRKLNSQFDKYTNVITPTFPYYMLKKFERGE